MMIMDDSDNKYFKGLLDLVPPQVYFDHDDKDKIRNAVIGEREGKKKGAVRLKDPLTTTTITALQTTLQALDAREEKIQGKKDSKQKKKKKEKSEKTSQVQVNIQEVQAKLRARITELQAKRRQGLSGEELQEQKRLERKQRRLAARNRQKNKVKAKGDSVTGDLPLVTAPVLKKPSKPIINQDGKLVFSKFDFTHSVGGEKVEKEHHSSSLVGKDYKRLLQRLEHRETKVSKVAKDNPEAAAKLEQKNIWQDVVAKARGEKVKDDPVLLKKALKRKEKIKEQRQKKWVHRQTAVQDQKKVKQGKRESNIEKRKEDKKAKHRKKLIKKGRLLPGF